MNPRIHLDMEAVFWLEDYLAGWSKILFFVSHSQDFMNGVCTHIVRWTERVHGASSVTDEWRDGVRHTTTRTMNQRLHLEAVGLRGNYDSYVRERSIRDDEQQRKYDAEQRTSRRLKISSRGDLRRPVVWAISFGAAALSRAAEI